MGNEVKAFFTVKELAERYGVSPASIWRWVNDPATGGFPKPVSLSPGTTRWRRSDIEAWEASRAVAAFVQADDEGKDDGK